jgi:hypothetical protein
MGSKPPNTKETIMADQIGRRDFLKSVPLVSAGAAAAAGSAENSPPPYRSKWYEFSQHAESDTCWSLSVGPDGRIYAASCAEGAPGGVVNVYRYNEHTDSLDRLFAVDKIIDDPGDSGRATQCKIHYSFAPSMSDGVLYMATHVSGPPFDMPVYSSWYSWYDEKRAYRGSALMAFDTKTDQVRWWDTLIPKEGCRCLAFDEERGLLYAVTYPLDHLISYDVSKRRRRDLGRIGSVNAQALFLDKKHRVWTTSDYGRLVRYSPDRDRLELSPSVLPHNPSFQTGWHSVFYDAVAAPDRESVFASTWIAQPYLMRIWPNEGEWPRVENLGPLTQDRDLSLPMDTFHDHCGGLTFAGDGQLYYVASRWRDPAYHVTTQSGQDTEGVVWRLDPATGRRQAVALLEHPQKPAQYVSRGAVDHNGDLFFGHVGNRPSGIFKVPLPAERKKKDAHLPIRMWG